MFIVRTPTKKFGEANRSYQMVGLWLWGQLSGSCRKYVLHATSTFAFKVSSLDCCEV